MSHQQCFAGAQPFMKVNPTNLIPDTDRSASQRSKFKVLKHSFAQVTTAETIVASDALVARNSSNETAGRPYRNITFVEKPFPHHVGAKQRRTTADGSPRKRRRTEKPDTRFTIARPVGNSSAIHDDIWSSILAYADPELLLKMRGLSRMFYQILESPVVWAASRRNRFGNNIPDSPYYLNERRYVDLLVSRGCQVGTCLRRDTRKVYWAFSARLCEDCLRQRTSIDNHADEPTPQSMYADLFDDIQDKEQYGKSLVDLIPSARTFSGKYRKVRLSNNDGTKWLSDLGASSYMYLKSDYQKVAGEFESIQNESWSAERVLEWTKAKYREAIRYCAAAYDIETWEDRAKFKQWRVPNLRDVREDFFVEKASKLPVPISRDVLQNMSAFKAALETTNAPSDRAWNILLPKLLPFLDQAEMIQRFKAQKPRFGIEPDVGRRPREAKIFKKLHKHRWLKRREGEWTPEQSVVLKLGRDEFARLNGNVADEDLLLLCLRNVYDNYQRLASKPEGMNCDGSTGVYQLSLDDARMMIEEVMQPEIDRFTLRGKTVFENFKCAGCTRHHNSGRWSFNQGLEHMYEKHATTVGHGLHFYRFAKIFYRPTEPLDRIPRDQKWTPRSFLRSYRFPWYLVEWTRSLPLLPSHAEVTAATKWDPDSEEQYVQMRPLKSASAFAGCRAAERHETATDDFADNFLYAAEALASTTLDTIHVTKIALKYALDLSLCRSPEPPDLMTFVEALQRAEQANPIMALKAKCGACCSQGDLPKRIQYARTPVRMRQLHEHWMEKHEKEGLDWTRHFLHLPSDHALLQTMQAQDEQLQQDQMQSVQRETIGIKKTVRKVPDKKAAALMGKETAMSVFERLFKRDDTTSWDHHV